MSPSWGQTLAAKADEPFQTFIQVEKPSDVTVSFTRRPDYPPGSEPAPPELTINSSTGEVLWTPTSAHEGKAYAATAEAAFSDADSRSDRVTFYVEVTNTAPAPVNNQVLGTIVGGDTLTDEERAQLQAQIDQIAQTLKLMQEQVNALAQSAPVACTVTHTVQAGETLSHIALHYYGNATRWPEIHEANRAIIGDNPDVIKVGQQLCVSGEIVSLIQGIPVSVTRKEGDASGGVVGFEIRANDPSLKLNLLGMAGSLQSYKSTSAIALNPNHLDPHTKQVVMGVLEAWGGAAEIGAGVVMVYTPAAPLGVVLIAKGTYDLGSGSIESLAGAAGVEVVFVGPAGTIAGIFVDDPATVERVDLLEAFVSLGFSAYSYTDLIKPDALDTLEAFTDLTLFLNQVMKEETK